MGTTTHTIRLTDVLLRYAGLFPPSSFFAIGVSLWIGKRERDLKIKIVYKPKDTSKNHFPHSKIQEVHLSSFSLLTHRSNHLSNSLSDLLGKSFLPGASVFFICKTGTPWSFFERGNMRKTSPSKMISDVQNA